MNTSDTSLKPNHSLFLRNKQWQDSLSLQKQTSSLLERELRSTVAFPRAVPRQLREKIAEVITFEILFGQPYEIKDPERFIGVFGAFYPIFLTLKNSIAWSKLQKIAKKSRGAGIAGLKILLPLIYDIMERFSEPSNSVSGVEYLKELDAGMDAILKEFGKILRETIAMWGNSSHGEGSNFQGKGNSAELALQEYVMEFMQEYNYQVFLKD
jgi:uncharacterized protein with von Willebrand factor type A (vWA) domain